MKHWSRRALITLASAAAAIAAAPAPDSAQPPQDGPRLPNGKSQRDEILKEEHQQNLKDAGRLAELADQLKQDLEKNDWFVVSLATIKKTDEIEKLAQKIRSRMRRY